MTHIPERSPIADVFTGALLTALPGADVIAQGKLIIRYAVEYLGKPHLALVPGLIALDYGDMLTGEAAWEFLLRRSNLYPRADVVGYRTDGIDDMTPVKWLDLAQPVQVWVYSDAAANTGLARVSAIIAGPDSVPDALPTRLLDYLPRYESIDDWQAAHE